MLTIQRANIVRNVPMATTVMHDLSLVNPFHVLLVHAQKDPVLVVNLLHHVTEVGFSFEQVTFDSNSST